MSQRALNDAELSVDSSELLALAPALPERHIHRYPYLPVDLTERERDLSGWLTGGGCLWGAGCLIDVMQ